MILVLGGRLFSPIREAGNRDIARIVTLQLRSGSAGQRERLFGSARLGRGLGTSLVRLES